MSSTQLSWHALKRFSLRPPSDLFSYIADEDLVEIYTLDNLQIFRSMSFFDLCSYSLEDLYCRPWYSLFYRDEGITQQIGAEAVRAFSGQETGVFVPNVADHMLKELDSPFKHEVEIQYKVMAPLYNSSGKIAAGLVVEKAKVVNRPKESDKERLLEAYYQSQNVDFANKVATE